MDTHDAGLPSPPLSANASTSSYMPPRSPTSSMGVSEKSQLPTARTHPLKSGSNKETAFINYIDDAIREIVRKFTKREQGSGHGDVAAATMVEDISGTTTQDGYRTFKAFAMDVSRVVNLVWRSGTPSLQVAYMLQLAGLVEQAITAFRGHLTPHALFSVLRKLDQAFAELLMGTEEAARNWEASGTEKVRMKGVVERTRVVVVEALDQEADSTPDQKSEADEEEQRGDSFGMETARVYERTLGMLGDTLGGTSQSADAG